MYGKQLVLDIVEVTGEGHTCADGQMLFNPNNYKYITKHRDCNNNEFTCIHFMDGTVQFVSNHPLEIKKLIEGQIPTGADVFEVRRDLPANAPLKVVPKVAVGEKVFAPTGGLQFPDSDEEPAAFKTQITRRRGRPVKG